MRDEPVPEVRARSGQHWMHLSVDLWVAVKEMLHGRLSPWDYLRELLEERESAIFAWDDPLPGIFDLPLYALTAGRRMALG
jgi:D-aspartate ligase